MYTKKYLKNPSLEKKIKFCRQLYLQNVSISSEDLFKTFCNEIQCLGTTSIDSVFMLQFDNFEKTKHFYDTKNFMIYKNIERPLNLYFNLNLQKGQCISYLLKGITQKKQRKIFQAAIKIGICRLDTKYTLPEYGKLRSTGILKFIRNQQLLSAQFTQLQQQLKVLRVTIQKYTEIFIKSRDQQKISQQDNQQQQQESQEDQDQFQNIQQQNSIETKIQQCNVLCLQNIEKTSLKNALCEFLKSHQSKVQNIKIDELQNRVQLYFSDHLNAMEFYKNMNFKQKIGTRKINMYFKIPLLKPEQTQNYLITGVTEQNQRQLFEASLKIGICKFWTHQTDKNKLKKEAVLSFIRDTPLSNEQYKLLQEFFISLKVKINPFSSDEDNKLFLSNCEQTDAEQTILKENDDDFLMRKVNNCEKLIIRNMKKGKLTENLITKFLEEQKLTNSAKLSQFYPRSGKFKLVFSSSEKARQFFDTKNFKEPYLTAFRLLDIQFDVEASVDQMITYNLEGITFENRRDIFQIAQSIGLSKIQSYYHQKKANVLLPKGLLSFYRTGKGLQQNKYEQLKQKLKNIKVKISKYNSSLDQRSGIILSNFINWKLPIFKQIDLLLKKNGNIQQNKRQAQTKLDKYIDETFGEIFENKIAQKHIQVEFRQIKNNIILWNQAIIEFDNFKQTITNYEKLRKYLANSLIKVTLTFYENDFDSYMVLYTTGIMNGQKELLQNELLQVFKKVNKDIVQVILLPTKIKQLSSFNCQIYFAREQSGKDFIVDYTNSRGLFFQYYLDKNNISFNIHASKQKIEQDRIKQKNASVMMKNIKQKMTFIHPNNYYR